MADIAKVIQMDSINGVFVQKHPQEDFNTGSQLIVHESQEALFFMNGQALDLFGPGRHTLETQNIPFIGKLFNLATNNKNSFHCEVYFINKTEHMAIKWGTDSKVEYMDPTYNFPIKIGASGEMSLRADDSRKLLVKLVGTDSVLTRDSLVAKFRAFLMTKVKSYLASTIRESKIQIFSIDEHLENISNALLDKLKDDFSDYGVALERFFLSNIVKPEEDKMYQKFKEINFRQYADIAEASLRQQVGIMDQTTAAQRMVIESQGLAQKRANEGYTYQDERGFDVASTMASNEAIGQMTNLGVGLGMMTGVGGAVGGFMSNTMGGVLNPQAQQPQAQPQPQAVQDAQAPATCPNCNNPLPPNAKFCLECGQKIELLAENEMICPSCNAKTPKGKFCIECGHSLKNSCPNCGTEVPPNGKFCLECGQKL